METFIGNLIGFAVIIFLVVRYVVPPVRRMMTARQDTVRQQLKDSEAAADRLTQSKSAHSRAVEDAESEAEKIVEDAKADAGRIVEQLQAQAKVDSERIVAQGARQTELLRVQLMRQLRLELGHESVRQATDLVRDFVADAKQQSSTVDRLLDELDDMAPAAADVQYPLLAKMRSASRRALSDVSDRFKDIAKDLDRKALTTVSRELVDVAKFLNDEIVVTRYLTVASEDAAPRIRLIERLMSDKVGDSTLELLRAVASQRWSANSDLVDVIEHLSRQALLEIAERDDKVGLVEDQLFQISRVLDSQPKLAILLGDSNVPAQGRADLLNKVLSSARAVNPVARALLTQTIELLRGGPAVEAIQFLIEVAVARRGEVVAQVKAAAEPSAAQRTRLAEILGRIYGHPVTLHLDIDAALLGGLLISVADEVIDGTLSSRLAVAEAQLPD